MFVHDGGRLLVPPSLQGTVVQNTAEFSYILTEVLRFKKKKNKNLYFGFCNLENYSLYGQKACNSLTEYIYLIFFH